MKKANKKYEAIKTAVFNREEFKKWVVVNLTNPAIIDLIANMGEIAFNKGAAFQEDWRKGAYEAKKGRSSVHKNNTKQEKAARKRSKRK